MAQRSDTRSEEKPVSLNGGLALAVAEPKEPLAPPAVATPWRSYKEQIAAIAQRIVDAQRPIRVLQALRWEPAVEEAFRREPWARAAAGRARRLRQGRSRVRAQGQSSTSSRTSSSRPRPSWARRIPSAASWSRPPPNTAKSCACSSRAGPKSSTPISRRLYGSPKDKFPDGKTSVRDLGLALYDILTAISSGDLGPKQPSDIDAEARGRS